MTRLLVRYQTRMTTRGVTFIEYALLAAIAVVVGFLFRSQLTGMFTTLLGKISGGLSTTPAG